MSEQYPHVAVEQINRGEATVETSDGKQQNTTKLRQYDNQTGYGITIYLDDKGQSVENVVRELPKE